MHTSEFYVYAYLDPRAKCKLTVNGFTFDHLPFYIGKGKGGRIKSHLTMNHKNHKCHTIKNILSEGLNPILIIIKDKLPELDALELESLFIRNIGTRSYIEGVISGPLTNLKTDGAVQKYSEESKTKMSEAAKLVKHKPHSAETIQKMKDYHANKSDEKRQYLIDSAKRIHTGVKKSVEHKAKISLVHKGKTISPEHKAKISLAQTGKIASEKSKKLMSENQFKTYELLIESSGDIIFVRKLGQWCSDNGIKHVTLASNSKRNKFHKGYKIVGSSGGRSKNNPIRP